MVYNVLWCNMLQTKPGTPGPTPSLCKKCIGFCFVHVYNMRDLWLYVPSEVKTIMVKCLAYGHKCHDHDSKPHADDQKYKSLSPECSYSLGCDTTCTFSIHIETILLVVDTLAHFIANLTQGVCNHICIYLLISHSEHCDALFSFILKQKYLLTMQVSICCSPSAFKYRMYQLYGFLLRVTLWTLTS